HKDKNNSVGKMSKPVPKLKEARNPAHIISSIVARDWDDFRSNKKASAAPAIVKEFIQLRPPDEVILARAIQKLPTITTRVDKVFAVRLTVLSHKIGIKAREVVIKSRASPVKKSSCWLPWKKRRSTSQIKLGKNNECPMCFINALSS